MTKKQLQSEEAFADKMTNDSYDLYDRSCRNIHTSTTPKKLRDFYVNIIDLAPLSITFTDKDLLLLYHSFEVRDYPVPHPSPPGTGADLPLSDSVRLRPALF